MQHVKRKGSPVNTRVDTHFWPDYNAQIRGLGNRVDLTGVSLVSYCFLVLF